MKRYIDIYDNKNKKKQKKKKKKIHLLEQVYQ